ncbi:hypothetical protein KI387_022662, partial [Taxus chinensis]
TMALSSSGQASYPKTFCASHSSFFGSNVRKYKSSNPMRCSKENNNFKVVAEIDEKKQTDKDRWKRLVYDISDDQHDITRGKGMVDTLFQAIIMPFSLVIPLILGIWGGKGQGKSFQYFFGSLRARVYDDEVTKWIGEVGVESIGKNLINSREGPPTFQKHAMTVEKLLEYGNMLVKEQENVKRVQLADKYMAEADLGEANEDAIKIGAFYGKAAQQVNLPIPEGCTDPSAENYDPTTRNDDGTCVYNFQ